MDRTGFRDGDRVRTPDGAGRVVYRRLAPPDFGTVAAYSVHLDVRGEDQGYCGSVYAAADVQAEDEG